MFQSTTLAQGSVCITPVAERQSSLFLNKFEVARLVGERATQLTSVKNSSFSGGSTPTGLRPRRSARHVQSGAMISAEKTSVATSLCTDPVMIAKHELKEKLLVGIIVQRTFPSGHVENIPLNELEVDETLLDLRF